MSALTRGVLALAFLIVSAGIEAPACFGQAFTANLTGLGPRPCGGRASGRTQRWCREQASRPFALPQLSQIGPIAAEIGTSRGTATMARRYELFERPDYISGSRQVHQLRAGQSDT